MEARKAHVSQRSTYFFRLLDVRYVDFSKTIITDNAVFFNIDFDKAPEPGRFNEPKPKWFKGTRPKERIFKYLHYDIAEVYYGNENFWKGIEYDNFYIARDIRNSKYPLRAFAYRHGNTIYDMAENTLIMEYWLMDTMYKEKGIKTPEYDEYSRLYNKFCADTEEWIKERVRLTIEETGGEFMTDAITDNSYCQLRNIDGETVAICIEDWSKQIKNGKYKTL